MKSYSLKMTTLFAVLLFVGTVALLSVTALAATDTVLVQVEVLGVSQIEVVPDTLNWTGNTPGSAGGLKFLDINNIGSVNVTNLYVDSDTLDDEGIRPYTSASANSYAGGGVIVLHNSSDGAFYWAGRLEWNETEPIPNIDLSAITADSRRAQGFFRNASVNFAWAVGNGSNGFCNNTNALFAIEDDVDVGTTATRTPTTAGITRSGGDLNWSYFTISRPSSVLSGHCVAVNTTCEKIFIYKYDRRTSPFNFATCANASYLRYDNIVPGGNENITLNAYIPRGTPQGNLTFATLTFTAT